MLENNPEYDPENKTAKQQISRRHLNPP